jgi:hypothetical protein
MRVWDVSLDPKYDQQLVFLIFLIGPLISVNFLSLNLLYKIVLIWKNLAPRRIPKLESGKEPYVYGKLNAGILESGTPILNT